MKIKHLLAFIATLCCFNVFAQTRFNVKFTFDGAAREFILVKPSGAVPAGGYPVVFMFHGTTGDGEKFYNISGWKEKGETEKFITVFPTSLEYCFLNFPNNNPLVGTKWNNGDLQEAKCPNVAQTFKDDVKFIRKMVDTIKQSLTVNPKKIYAAGFSNGCSMIHKLLIDAPDVFAAVAGASAILTPLDSANPSRKIPIWNIIGNMDDRLLTLTGRTSISTQNDSILILVDSYIKRVQGCEGLTNTYTKSSNATMNNYTYKTPKAGESATTFTFSLVKDMVHEFPNGVNHPLSAPTIFWDFFKQATATDIKETQLPESAVILFPNPSKESMSIKLPENTEGGKVEISVFNTLGQQIYAMKNEYNPIINLNKTDVGQGLFILKVKIGDKFIVKKAIFE